MTDLFFFACQLASLEEPDSNRAIGSLTRLMGAVGTQWELSTLPPGQNSFPLRSLVVGGIVTVLAPPRHQRLAIALLVQSVT